MRIRAITESVRLDEKLGNLAQLNLGKLAGLLKQDTYKGVGTKFTSSSSYYSPGNTSKIIDAGVIKQGLKDLRKAYRDGAAQSDGAGDIVGFALYLQGQTVAFGLFSDLAGSRPEGKFSYDLTPFEKQVNDQQDQKNAGKQSWQQPPRIKPTSAYDKKDTEYPNGWSQPSVEITRNFVGRSQTVGELAGFMEDLMSISQLVGEPVTCKLITSDKTGSLRGQARRQLSYKDVKDAAEDLKRRLVKFKNAKRPTAENIHQFLEMVTSRAANVINLGGRPWKTEAKNGYDKIDPVKLMQGTPFSISYDSADPGSYESLKVHYRYDPTTNLLKPWKANWTTPERTDKTVVLDHSFWIMNALGVKDLEKPTVVRKMLTMLKDSPGTQTFKTIEAAIGAMRKLGEDWPEFAVIEKSVATERAKEAQKSQ
jgi:hypothetical protein